MNSAERIIDKFGGKSALARALGKAPSTTRYWAQTGRVPAKYHSDILALAREQRIHLQPVDFVDTTDSIDQELSDEVPAIPIAEWPGVLKVGEAELPVYVLHGGRRIISRTGATDMITGRKGGGNLESYLGVGALKGYIPEDWQDSLIEFTIPGVQNKSVRGITADMFLNICRAYVQAFDDDALVTDRQKDIATKASMFLAACAGVGLTALIDEATGYQYERAEDALEFKLQLFLETEMRKWEATFPDELWREFGRLTNWSGGINQRPRYWGKLVMELVYGYLDPDVSDWLRRNNPKPHKGQNHHQWLSSQYGLRKLTEHIWMVIGLAKACETMAELKTRMAEMYGREQVLFTMHLPPRNTSHSALPPADRLPPTKRLSTVPPGGENTPLPLDIDVSDDR